MKLFQHAEQSTQLRNTLISFLIPTILFSLSTSAFAIEFEHGDFYGSFDTTVSYGQIHRAQGVDRDIVAISNAGSVGPTGAIAFPVPGGITGSALSANFDDGNTNYTH